jgi:hypothetical protein
MEIPGEVLVHNEQLGVKGGKGTLLRVAEEGYYEVNLRFGTSTHRVLLPVASTVLISSEPEPSFAEQVEVER